MKIYKLEDFDRGYFIGNFPKSIFKTNAFEVASKFHYKGDKHDLHIHKYTTEFMLVVRGKVKVNGQIMEQGNIFTLEPYEVNDISYLEDTELVVVKSPSLPDDRIILKYV